MSQSLAGVQPCLDFAHLHARPGDGSMNTYAEWSRVLEAYAQALGEESLQHLHIHLSGIAYGPKGEKEHLPLSEADLDLKAIFLALHIFACRGRILCESPAMEDDALILQNLWLEVSQENPN